MEYLKDWNSVRAAEVAGYQIPQAAGPRLLNHEMYPCVYGEIERMLMEKRRTCQIEAQDIIRELVFIGFFNPKSLMDDQGRLIPLHKLPNDVASAISEMETVSKKDKFGSTRTRTTTKTHSKLTALRQIAELLGYLRDKLPAPQQQTNVSQVNIVGMSDEERRDAILAVLSAAARGTRGPERQLLESLEQTDHRQIIDGAGPSRRLSLGETGEDPGNSRVDSGPLADSVSPL